tara:strand:- start:24068 stop:24313 length:246 start_codon:yes stop_codon:yes gene_type:complete
MELHHPEHLEPDPLKREKFCPVKIVVQTKMMSVPEVRAEIIKAKTKTEVIAVLLQWAGQHGINSNTDPDDEWWKKREKLGV